MQLRRHERRSPHLVLTRLRRRDAVTLGYSRQLGCRASRAVTAAVKSWAALSRFELLSDRFYDGFHRLAAFRCALVYLSVEPLAFRRGQMLREYDKAAIGCLVCIGLTLSERSDERQPCP